MHTIKRIKRNSTSNFGYHTVERILLNNKRKLSILHIIPDVINHAKGHNLIHIHIYE